MCLSKVLNLSILFNSTIIKANLFFYQSIASWKKDENLIVDEDCYNKPILWIKNFLSSFLLSANKLEVAFLMD